MQKASLATRGVGHDGSLESKLEKKEIKAILFLLYNTRGMLSCAEIWMAALFALILFHTAQDGRHTEVPAVGRVYGINGQVTCVAASNHAHDHPPENRSARKSKFVGAALSTREIPSGLCASQPEFVFVPKDVQVLWPL